MTLLIVNFILAVLPALMFFLILWKHRRPEDPPFTITARVFLLGCMAVLPALFAELFLVRFIGDRNTVMRIFFRAFILSALIEEGCKLLVLRRWVYPLAAFKTPAEGIRFAAAAAFGFAVFENSFFTTGASWILLLRGVTAVPLHISASVILGYYLGASKLTRRPLWKRGFLAAVLLHGTYNLTLFLGGVFTILLLPVLAAGIGSALHLYRRARRGDSPRSWS